MKIARIPSSLLTKELSAQLKLQNQYYVVLIPKIVEDAPEFDLIYENEKLSLVSSSETETTAPPAKEVVN